MSKFIGFAAALAFLCSDISIATALDDGGWLTCKDGLKVRGARSCDNHGGMLIAQSTTIPIDTTKKLGPNKTATPRKTEKQKTAAATATEKKTVSKRTRTPTAKCMDGAMYFSTERRGACLSHGGVRTWF